MALLQNMLRGDSSVLFGFVNTAERARAEEKNEITTFLLITNIAQPKIL